MQSVYKVMEATIEGQQKTISELRGEISSLKDRISESERSEQRQVEINRRIGELHTLTSARYGLDAGIA